MITVSVCMITYGHENYIKQAIEGVLMQKTTFEIELVIANDCSPDDTHLVIEDIINNHPYGNLIVYENHKNNLGIMPNLLFAIEKCKGKYIAMCEGDDYWITNDKLQKQIDILELNNKIGLVYTGVKFFNQISNQFIAIPSKYPAIKDDAIPMMLDNKFIEFPTTVFRTSVLNQVMQIIKPELDKAVIGDTRILLETLFQSGFYFLEEVTTVYRVAEGSASYPRNIDKYIFVLLDTFKCRKQFVERNGLSKKLLSKSFVNLNKAIINKAFTSVDYATGLKILKSVKVEGIFSYINWRLVKYKTLLIMCVKLLLTCLGLGVLKQKMARVK